MLAFLKKRFKSRADIPKLVKHGAIIIDVRTKSEFQAGHIRGLQNIPLDTIKEEATTLKNLNKPIVTVCRSGNRSGIAKSILSVAGVEVYNGGAWTNLKRQLH